MELTRKNPWQHNFVKAGVPNFDPIFGSGFPYSWFDTNAYTAMRQRPGINHPWVYAAISTIVSAYVQCPLRFYSKRDPKKELIDDHPILTLFERPNPHLSGTNLLECIVWALGLPTRRTTGGQCFLWGDDCNFRKGEVPDELWLQGDESVKPIRNEQKILQAWEFNYQDGVSPYDYGQGMRLDLQQTIRINNLNPYNNLAGAAPGYAVRTAISQDATALEMNTAMMANGGQMRGVFTGKKPMSTGQMDEFRANIKKYSEGVENTGKNMFLPWEMEFSQLSLTPQDMQYVEQFGLNRDQILAVHRVSKFAVQQYEDLNYATAKEAKRQLFDQAILPMNKLIMQEFNSGWIKNVDKGDLVLTVDLSEVTALHDDLDARWKRAEIAVQMSIPPLIALKMNGIPVDDLKGLAWLMENQSPSAAFSAPAADDASEKDKGADPVKKKALNPELRKLSADHIARVRVPGEREVTAVIRRFYIAQRNRTQDLVDQWERVTTDAKQTGPDFLKLDPVKEDSLLRGAMMPAFRAQAKRSLTWARAQIAEVSKSTKADDAPPEVQTQDEIEAFLMKRLTTLSQINRTSFKGVEAKVAEIIAKGISDELTTAQIAKALKEGIADVYDGRRNDVMNVAITETGTVATRVQYIAMKAADIEYKGWLASHVEHFRPSHQAEEEVGAIPIHQRFPNTGMDHPLEDGAPASEVCYCHCCLVAMRPPEGK